MELLVGVEGPRGFVESYLPIRFSATGALSSLETTMLLRRKLALSIARLPSASNRTWPELPWKSAISRLAKAVVPKSSATSPFGDTRHARIPAAMTASNSYLGIFRGAWEETRGCSV